MMLSERWYYGIATYKITLDGKQWGFGTNHTAVRQTSTTPIREDGRGGIRGEIAHLLVELDDTRMCR